MTGLTRASLAAAALAAVASLGYVLAPGEAAVVRVGAPCEVLAPLALPEHPLDCAPGSQVYGWTVAGEEADPEAVLPPGVYLDRASVHALPLADLPAGAGPGVVLPLDYLAEPPPCLAGPDVRRRTSEPGVDPPTYWTPPVGQACCGDACECTGSRCARLCSPTVMVDDCPARVCERWPETCLQGL